MPHMNDDDKVKGSEEDILEDAKQFFDRASEAEELNRAEALDDIRFARDSEQWPQEVKRDREQDGRPCLTINRMPAFIRQVVNDSRQNKPAIKVHPVDDKADVKTADILNGLIRNIEVISNADIAYDTAIDCAVTGGFGYLRIKTDYAHDDSFELDILIERVPNQFSVYGDPMGCAGDGSDWMEAMVTSWMPKAEYRERWGNKKGDEPANFLEGATGDVSDPNWITDDAVRIAEYWVRTEVKRQLVKLADGQIRTREEYDEQADLFEAAGLTIVDEREGVSYKVMQHWVGGGKVLESVEWPGRYIPIVPVYGDEYYVDGKMRLKSLIRDAKDAQRMFNYWRTNATEMVALAPKTPFIGKEGFADADPDKWATANVKNHAYLEYSGDNPPQRQPFVGPAGGALQEALNAADDMKAIMGLHDASLGARSNETSGRAIMARQREGDNSTFHFLDNMTRAIRQAGKILVDLIPKVYDTPRMLRIIGEDQKPQTVQVNQPFIDQPGGPEQIYDLTLGKYDVTVQAGPSYTTKREEVATALVEIMRGNPQSAALLMDVFVKNQDWPEHDMIARRFQALLPPQIQAMENGQQPIPPQVAQQMQQAQQQTQQMAQVIQGLQGQLQKMQQENLKAQAEAFKAQSELKISNNEVQIAQITSATKVQDSNNRLNESYIKAVQPAAPVATDYPQI